MTRTQITAKLIDLGFGAWDVEQWLAGTRKMILGGPSYGLTTTENVAVTYRSGRYTLRTWPR